MQEDTLQAHVTVSRNFDEGDIFFLFLFVFNVISMVFKSLNKNIMLSLDDAL